MRRFSTSATLRAAYILSAARTPIGNFNGSLSKVSAVELGAVAAKAAISRAGIEPKHIQEVMFGHVLQGNVGQAPARQVGIAAGIPTSAEAVTINKVCASGLKTVSLAAQSVLLGDRDVVLAGGTESMSLSPFYVQRSLGFGGGKLVDSIVGDALSDPYNKIHMGNCCENTNKREGITREDQDNYAIESYKRAQKAISSGLFKDEIAPVEIKSKKGSVLVDADEAPNSVKLEKIPTLRAAFEKDGTVTAANASSINDGAAALVVASANAAKSLGSKVLAKIVSYADAATDPIDFTIAPSLAIPKALERAKLTKDDISVFEINEAFAGVSLANNKILGLDAAKVNPRGGAVALGHPVGASGARILVTLLHQLKDGEYGLAAVCNGGGAATAVVVQKVNKLD